MLIHLGEGEQVLRLEPAGLSAGGERVQGALCLTPRRLVFKRLAAADDDPGQSIPLDRVVAARPVRALGLLTIGLGLELEGGERVRLRVADPGSWAEDVEAARRGEGRAAFDPAALDGPVEPVVSTPAVLAWIVAPLAFLPVAGIVPALGLLACGVTLLLGRKRAQDRNVGLAATALAGLGLALGAVGLVCLLLHGGAPELPTGVHQRVTLPMRIAQVAVLVLSIVLHECGHGLSAWWAGDTTALRAKRLTLNPIRHLDLFGSVILPGILIVTSAPAIFGWAKPVPVSPSAFRRKKLGNIAVSLAGVSANLLLALACVSLLVGLGATLRLLSPEVTTSGFWLPSRPTLIDGVPGAGALALVADLLKTGVLVNLILMGFNLLPIPPLDGSHVLETLLPEPAARLFARLRAFGFVILAVVLFTGALDSVLQVFVGAALVLLYSAGVVCGLG